MVRVKPEDRAAAIIERILTEPVPDEGHLQHPIQPKKRKTGQLTLEELTAKSEFPEEILIWTTRTMVDYFARRYQEVTGGNYRKIYRADQITFQELFKWMSSNGLEPKEWTKNLIDWSFGHFDSIRAKYGYFTPTAMQRMTNYWYQDVVLPSVEEGKVERNLHDTSLLEELQEADAAGKATEMFVRFGIPVTMTYILQVRDYPEDRALQAVNARLQSLLDGGAEEHEVLRRILQASVIGSPYPDTFSHRDWRETFAHYCASFHKEVWWRDADYKGRPLPKYHALTANK